MSNLKNQLSQLALDEFNSPTTIEACPPPDTALKLHVDGSANPNPGIMRIGLVLHHHKEIIWSGQLTLGEGTNNEAEFHAIIRGVAFLKKITAQLPSIANERCTIISDSRLATNALLKSKTPKNARLAVLYTEAKTALSTLDKTTICWQPRARNVSADLVTHNLRIQQVPSTGTTSV